MEEPGARREPPSGRRTQCHPQSGAGIVSGRRDGSTVSQTAEGYARLPMEFGLQTNGNYDTLLEAARFAQDRGMAALALPDHYLLALDEESARATPANDAFAQFAGLARDTAGLDLVALVSPVTFRHPAVLVKTAITIHNMSGGRFRLGVGTGWFDLEHDVFGLPYPDMAERYAMLEEALGYIRAALDPEAPGFQGERYRLMPFPLNPAPVSTLPLVVGGRGPHKTPALAGRYADEFNVYPGHDLADRIARARSAAAEAGRDPSSLFLSTSGQVIGADTEAELQAILDERAAEAGMTRAELDEYVALRNSPIATWDRLAEMLAEWEALGIERFYFQGNWDPVETPRVVDRLAS